MVATENDRQAQRKEVMAVLAHSDSCEISGRLDAIALPDHESLREPENGLVMVRGRIGGDGAPFNLGEATVTRAAVRLAGGEVGFAYVLGRDTRKARLIAICDAMLQTTDRARVVDAVVAPLERAMIERRRHQDAETAATKVNFFTLVRGEG